MRLLLALIMSFLPQTVAQVCTGYWSLTPQFLQQNCTSLSGTFLITDCPACDMTLFNLTHVDLLSVQFTNLINLDNFSTITSVVSLSISGNPFLENVDGLTNNLIGAASINIQTSPITTLSFPALWNSLGRLWGIALSFSQLPNLISIDFPVVTSLSQLTINYCPLAFISLPQVTFIATLSLNNLTGYFPLVEGIYGFQLGNTVMSSWSWFPSLDHTTIQRIAFANMAWDTIAPITDLYSVTLASMTMTDFRGWSTLRRIQNKLSVTNFPFLQSLDGLHLDQLDNAEFEGCPMLRSVDALATLAKGTLILDDSYTICCPASDVFASTSPLIRTVMALCVVCKEFTGNITTLTPVVATQGVGVLFPVYISSQFTGTVNVNFCSQDQVWFASSSCVVGPTQTWVVCQMPLLNDGDYYLSWYTGCTNLTVGNPSPRPIVVPTVTIVNWSSYFEFALAAKIPGSSQPIMAAVDGDHLPTPITEVTDTTNWEIPLLCAMIGVSIILFAGLKWRKKDAMLIDVDFLGYQRSIPEPGESGKPEKGDGQGPDRKVLRRRTPLGGLLSIFVVVIAMAMGLGYLTMAVSHNTVTTGTLDPNIASKPFPTSTFRANITIMGYRGSCIDDSDYATSLNDQNQTTGNCGSGLVVTTTTPARGVVSTTCTSLPPSGNPLAPSCLVQWGCENCVLGLSTKIAITNDVNSFATGFAWTLTSRSYIGTDHRTTSSIQAPPGYFFKGSPTTVTVSATAANFSAAASKGVSQGVLLKQVGAVSGALQSPDDFSINGNGGAQITIDIVRNLNVMVVVETTQRTGMDILVGTMAILSGILQAGRVFSFAATSTYKKVERS